jgi:hypothetical protein
MLGGRAYAEGTYIWRGASNFIEDYLEIGNGVTQVVRDGLDVGTFTNNVYRNTSSDITRNYQALVFQGRYNVNPNLVLNGNWTVQLKNDGNYEGEEANQPGATSLIGDYPEAFDPNRNFPLGRLSSFQRQRARFWAIYSRNTSRWGNYSLSGTVRAESGTSYSLRATSQPLTPIQAGIIEAAGYPDAPSDQSVYFGGRGSELFKGYAVVDTSFNYEIPVFRTARPFLKLDIFNLLNNDKQIAWNVVVSQDPNSPKDALGLATGYRQGSRFGQGTSNAHYPQNPQTTVGTGLRGFRLALGFRF